MKHLKCGGNIIVEGMGLRTYCNVCNDEFETSLEDLKGMVRECETDAKESLRQDCLELYKQYDYIFTDSLFRELVEQFVKGWHDTPDADRTAKRKLFREFLRSNYAVAEIVDDIKE